jgi:hypothetical protein
MKNTSKKPMDKEKAMAGKPMKAAAKKPMSKSKKAC